MGHAGSLTRFYSERFLKGNPQLEALQLLFKKEMSKNLHHEALKRLNVINALCSGHKTLLEERKLYSVT